MKRTLPLISAFLTCVLLAACVDTTGISKATSKGPSPKSNANSAVAVTEYGDLECPACKAAYQLLVTPMLQKYGSQIRFEFKQFPLQSIHRYAMDAAQASECAADQGKFWEFVDIAYQQQDNLNTDVLYTWAKQLGLDAKLFDRCLRSGIKHDAVVAEYNDGLKLGVQGTPTFFVNGKKVDTASLTSAIDTALATVGKNL